nr:(4Fe-4S)-binding protein [uncultured Algibacter sp.]
MTVTYDPCICKQSDTYSKQLSAVFRDSVIPWIDIDAAPVKDIEKQIRKCPSGTLKFKSNKKVVA